MPMRLLGCPLECGDPAAAIKLDEVLQHGVTSAQLEEKFPGLEQAAVQAWKSLVGSNQDNETIRPDKLVITGNKIQAWRGDEHGEPFIF